MFSFCCHVFDSQRSLVLTASWSLYVFMFQGGAVRSQHLSVPMGVDMNDPSAIARFRGQPYQPGPRQFDTYQRLVGPRPDGQQMYSVCPDSQPPSYQVCIHLILSMHPKVLVNCGHA